MSGYNATPGKYLQQATKTLYESVIGEVLNGVRDSFYDEGLDDSALTELRDLWMRKLDESKVLEVGQNLRMDQRAEHKLRQVQMEQQLKGERQQAHHNKLAAQKMQEVQENNRLANVQRSYPGQQTTQPSLAQHGPPGGHSISNIMAQNRGGMSSIHNHPAIPSKQARMQVRTATGEHIDTNRHTGLKMEASDNQGMVQGTASHAHQQRTQAQQLYQHQQIYNNQQQYHGKYHADGHLDDSNSESESDKSESVVSSSSEESEGDADSKSSEEKVSSTEADAEPIELNSDDDIKEDDAKTFDNCTNTVICQFEVVRRRSQARWSIKLKDGVMHIDNRDYVFSKCVGEADW